MTDLIKILESFNRKERFFLIREAAGEEAFSLSEGYRQKLASAIGVDEIPCDAFVAMDYHLDWIHASLFLADKPGEKGPFCNDIEVSTGSPQDTDLLVAFKSESGGVYHLILVEAKAYSSWDNEQLKLKAERLCKIFGRDGKRYGPHIIPHFNITSRSKPQKLKTEGWPKWMSAYRFIELKIPERRKVTGCHQNGEPTDERPYFKIENV